MISLQPEEEVLTEGLAIVRPLNATKNDNTNYHQIVLVHREEQQILAPPREKHAHKVDLVTRFAT